MLVVESNHPTEFYGESVCAVDARANRREVDICPMRPWRNLLMHLGPNVGCLVLAHLSRVNNVPDLQTCLVVKPLRRVVARMLRWYYKSGLSSEDNRSWCVVTEMPAFSLVLVKQRYRFIRGGMIPRYTPQRWGNCGATSVSTNVVSR
ncbi:MAG: hypothetical protein Ct9H300mP25_11540 [Acidobacteriota bacterium]|nr:MAG: hypothetical protein Ct9H300mP25_11540 [Acidobacteriota bacterium]